MSFGRVSIKFCFSLSLRSCEAKPRGLTRGCAAFASRLWSDPAQFEPPKQALFSRGLVGGLLPRQKKYVVISVS
jgi:hypothetical protein